jgi:hypothetical protein
MARHRGRLQPGHLPPGGPSRPDLLGWVLADLLPAIGAVALVALVSFYLAFSALRAGSGTSGGRLVRHREQARRWSYDRQRLGAEPPTPGRPCAPSWASTAPTPRRRSRSAPAPASSTTSRSGAWTPSAGRSGCRRCAGPSTSSRARPPTSLSAPSPNRRPASGNASGTSASPRSATPGCARPSSPRPPNR